MKFYYTYVLFSMKDHQFYIGFSENVFKRVEQHNNGENLSTKSRVPFELIYYEAHTLKEDALRREAYFKTCSGKRTLRQMLRNTLVGIKKKY